MFPDFTIPVMEKLGAAGTSCAREGPATSSTCNMVTTQVLKPTDFGTLQKDLARPFMRVDADELRGPLIYSTLQHPPNR